MIDWWKIMKRCGGRDWGSAPKGDFALNFHSRQCLAQLTCGGNRT